MVKLVNVRLVVSSFQLTVAQLLLVAQTDLALIVDLGADAGILVQIVLGAESEFGSVGAGGPRQLDGGFQTIVASLVDQTTEFAAIVAANGMKFCFTTYAILN